MHAGVSGVVAAQRDPVELVRHAVIVALVRMRSRPRRDGLRTSSGAILSRLDRSPALARRDGRSSHRGCWVHALRWVDWPYFLCIALVGYPTVLLIGWIGPAGDDFAFPLVGIIAGALGITHLVRRVRRVALARAQLTAKPSALVP